LDVKPSIEFVSQNLKPENRNVQIMQVNMIQLRSGKKHTSTLATSIAFSVSMSCSWMTFKSFVVDSKIILINSNDLQMLSSFRLSRVYTYQKHSHISGSEHESHCYSTTFYTERSSTVCSLFISGPQVTKSQMI